MTFADFIAQLKHCFLPLDLINYPGEFGATDNGPADVTRLAYATNLTPDTAQAAIQQGADMLLTHHDAWEFLYEMRVESYDRLKAASISHCFIHGPLDAAPFGTTVVLAKLLQLEVTAEFAEYEGLPCGRICTPRSPISFDDLAERFSVATGAGIRVWQNHSRSIQRIGITTGGGSLTDIVNEAAKLGCDTYITGETNLYTTQYAMNRGINLLIGTHTHTEFPGVESLCSKLQSMTELPLVPIHENDLETGALILPS